MSGLIAWFAALPAWLLDHPAIAGGAVVAGMAVWTLGGLALHLRYGDRQERRRNRRQYGP